MISSDTATTNSPTPVPLAFDGKHALAAGEIFASPDMARVLRDLGRDGAEAGIYEGRTGRAVVDTTLLNQNLVWGTSL
jgi:gamma-glutamyltranspeptidase